MKASGTFQTIHKIGRYLVHEEEEEVSCTKKGGCSG